MKQFLEISRLKMPSIELHGTVIERAASLNCNCHYNLCLDFNTTPAPVIYTIVYKYIPLMMDLVQIIELFAYFEVIS